MGLCLQNVGVLSADSRDNMGKFRWAGSLAGLCSAAYFLLRFHPFPPSHHLNQRQWHDPGFWYWHYLKHPEMQVSK